MRRSTIKTIKHWTHYPILVISSYLIFLGISKLYPQTLKLGVFGMLVLWTSIITFVDTLLHKYYDKEK